MTKDIIKKATALKYDGDLNSAPKVTAQGSGQIAKNIIQIAKENDIPIKEDADMVNLLSQIELNQEIPEEWLGQVTHKQQIRRRRQKGQEIKPGEK